MSRPTGRSFSEADRACGYNCAGMRELDELHRHDETGDVARSGNPALVAALRDAIAASPARRITFAAFMGRALYDPAHGYYTSAERRPGRGGDFITSPELSPYFGFTVANQIAECWARLGKPAPFTIREYGAGIGGLAYDMIAALSHRALALTAALRYELIEVNPHRRAQAETAMRAAGLGDRVTAHAAAGEPVVGVVLANEVADALPVHRLTWQDGRLRERWVGWNDERGAFQDVIAEPSPEVARLDVPGYLAGQGVTLTEGDAIEVSPAGERWMTEVAAGLARGYAIIIDYGYPARELYSAHRLEGTVRGHFAHTVTDDPYGRVGEQDLTAHVDFTRLQQAGEAAGLTMAGLTTQADFLANLGMGEELVQLQAQPDATLAEYYAAQAAVFRLIDPGGLGRFRVLAMAKDAPAQPPLRGFASPDLPPVLR